MDLFDTPQAAYAHEPLASRMRPRTLDEFVGQDHIVGQGRLLRRAIQADQLSSLIFYGPPGTGKTTLARVIANHTSSNFLTLNAVLTGVQHIRESIAQAEAHRKLYERKTILFVDEVHRWNKAQQDALLPWVENGIVILIGATTENPFFEVNKALVSRSRIFQLLPLEKKDLQKASHMALTDAVRGYGKWAVRFEDGALEHLIETANGDARSLLNALELAVETTPDHFPPVEGSEIFITMQTAEESIQQKVVLYDRDGDYHYDVISAFIKSIRGSDADASLYWLARMVAAGESPHFIFRRMMISACEDIGLADPYAVTVVESCAAAFDRIGLPEGRYHLTHAALYLATAPKSNSALAFFDALSAVADEDAQVPTHLKDASRDGEGFGHGQGYMYPHSYRDHWVAQQYLPSALTGRVFYTPGGQGYEKHIRSDVLRRRELQIAAVLEADETSCAVHEDILTFSPENKGRAMWQKRIESAHSETLLSIRSTLIEKAQLVRHHRCLIWNADDGLLLWEVLRNTPEGCTFGMCRSEKGKSTLLQYCSTLDDIEKPVLAVASVLQFFDKTILDGIPFDRIFYRDPCAKEADISLFAEQLSFVCESLRSSGSHFRSGSLRVCIAQKIPSRGQCLSAFIRDDISKELLSAFEETEKTVFTWDEKTLGDELRLKGFIVECTLCEYTEMQHISEMQLNRWFAAKTAAYGNLLREHLGSEQTQLIYAALHKKFLTSSHTTVPWHSTVAFYILTPLSAVL